MRIVRDIPKTPGEPLALIIGNFDGMHRGHRALADLICRRAAESGLESGALSFAPHPLAVLRGLPVRQIGGMREKIQHISIVNILFLLRFTKEFSRQSSAEFSAMIFDRLHVRHLAVGENFRFGRGREGDAELLQREGKRRGAAVEAVSLQADNGAPISSGRIRESLRRGDFGEAAALLGRPWTLSGRVVRGAGRGREIGFPTANLRLRFMPVCEGIFAAAARVDGAIFPAAVSIGKNPTIGAPQCLQTEAHIIGFRGDLYGRRLTLRPLRKLREEEKFTGMRELQSAIAADVAQTEKWWR
ncbi:MAG: riboflavin biosynthesis protein RibF, partial [Gammaproteobacteria bacterium]